MLKDIPDEQGIEMDQLGVSNIRYSTSLINDNDLFLSNQELLPSLDSPPIRGDVSRPNKPELSAANLDETPMKREETPPPLRSPPTRHGADEENFEKNNGCICCTVRGALVVALLGIALAKAAELQGAVFFRGDGRTSASKDGSAATPADAR